MTLPHSAEEDYYVSHELTSSSSGSIGSTEWREPVSVDGVDIDFQRDSFATCNTLPYESFARLPKTCRRLPIFWTNSSD